MSKRRISPVLIIGIIITSIFVIMSVVSFFYTPYDIEAMSYTEKFLSPSAKHIMGTDHFGRDIFSRVMYGVRNSICIAGVSIAVSFVIGTVTGIVTGYYGGMIDEILMRINDALTAIPSFLTAMVFVALMSRSTGTLILALTVAFIPSFARVARSQAINFKNRDFVKSARLMGVSDFRIMFKHILPNGRNTLITALTVGFNNAILAEAGLSFLGLGIQPPAPSIGGMLSEAQVYFVSAPHYVLLPGLVMVLLVTGVVMIGEGYGRSK